MDFKKIFKCRVKREEKNLVQSTESGQLDTQRESWLLETNEMKNEWKKKKKEKKKSWSKSLITWKCRHPNSADAAVATTRQQLRYYWYTLTMIHWAWPSLTVAAEQEQLQHFSSTNHHDFSHHKTRRKTRRPMTRKSGKLASPFASQIEYSPLNDPAVCHRSKVKKVKKWKIDGINEVETLPSCMSDDNNWPFDCKKKFAQLHK